MCRFMFSLILFFGLFSVSNAFSDSEKLSDCGLEAGKHFVWKGDGIGFLRDMSPFVPGNAYINPMNYKVPPDRENVFLCQIRGGSEVKVAGSFRITSTTVIESSFRGADEETQAFREGDLNRFIIESFRGAEKIASSSHRRFVYVHSLKYPNCSNNTYLLEVLKPCADFDEIEVFAISEKIHGTLKAVF